MDQIKCPNCKEVFKVDESGFADILKQVRDREFDQELNNRLKLADNEKENAIELAKANLRNKMQQHLTNKMKVMIKTVKVKRCQSTKRRLNPKEFFWHTVLTRRPDICANVKRTKHTV